MQRLLTVITLSLAAIAPDSYAADDYAAEIAASREMVKEFMQTLKQELQAGMREGGPINAVSVCNLTAPSIASTYSARSGWDVGRTSLKVRNPDNAPDAWERTALESFEARTSKWTPLQRHALKCFTRMIRRWGTRQVIFGVLSRSRSRLNHRNAVPKPNRACKASETPTRPVHTRPVPRQSPWRTPDEWPVVWPARR